MKKISLAILFLIILLLSLIPYIAGHITEKNFSTLANNSGFLKSDMGQVVVEKYTRRLRSSTIVFEWTAPQKHQWLLPQPILFDCEAQHKFFAIKYRCKTKHLLSYFHPSALIQNFDEHLNIIGEIPFFGGSRTKIELEPFQTNYSGENSIEFMGGQIELFIDFKSKPKQVNLEGEILGISVSYDKNQRKLGSTEIRAEIDFSQHPINFGTISFNSNSLQSNFSSRKLSMDNLKLSLSSFDLNDTMTVGFDLHAQEITDYEHITETEKTFNNFHYKKTVSGIKPAKLLYAIKVLKRIQKNNTDLSLTYLGKANDTNQLFENTLYKNIRIKNSLSLSEGTEKY